MVLTSIIVLSDSENDEVLPPRRAVGGEPMDYASSGVDIDAEGLAISSLVDALGSSVRAPGEKGAPVPYLVGSEVSSSSVIRDWPWQPMVWVPNCSWPVRWDGCKA